MGKNGCCIRRGVLQGRRDAVGRDAACVGVCRKLRVVTSLAVLGQAQQDMLGQQGVTSPASPVPKPP